MVDLLITPASVRASGAARIGDGIAGSTFTAGQSCYVDKADSDKVKLADNNGSAATADCKGITLHAATPGQPIAYAIDDPDFTPGATLTPGTIYTLSATPGGIAPASDLAAGMYTVAMLFPKNATKAVLKLVPTGTTV